MPNDNLLVPPRSIFPGDVAFAFNNEAPGAGQANRQFALPSYAGFPENGRSIPTQISFATAPTAVDAKSPVGWVVLGVALDRDDVDGLGLVGVDRDREPEIAR